MKLKIFVAAFLIVVLVLAFVSIVYFTEASVNYWQGTGYQYQKLGDRWVTIDYSGNVLSNGTFLTVYCQNKGSDSAFDLIVTLTNATFSQNSSTAKISFNLQDKDVHDTNLTFSIDENAHSFAILVSLQPKQLFLRSTDSNWLSQNPIPYYNYTNNTFEPALLA